MNIEELEIPGLLQIHQEVNEDERGSFTDGFQREKLNLLNFPKGFKIEQVNFSISKYGTIRGIHAEPWDKYIYVPMLEVFAAIVDLRIDSKTFGKVVEITLNADHALFVPQGCGNSFQALGPIVPYVYLVNDFWRPGLTYPSIAYNDPDLAINWPIQGEDQKLSPKDLKNPTMREVFGDAFSDRI